MSDKIKTPIQHALRFAVDKYSKSTSGSKPLLVSDAIISEWYKRSQRYSMELNIFYQAGKLRRKCFTKNISDSGLFVKTPKPPETGSWLILHLYPDIGVDPLHLVSEVVWSKSGTGFGAKFVNLSQFTKETLISLCQDSSAQN